MKIECPSCHLAGKINELELPPVGRELACPRCKNSFHVAKPPAAVGGNQPMMSSCPSCQYATFTEEMFAVCPKCGMTAEENQILSNKKRQREQLSRDQETLQRSFRNPDLVKTPVAESVAAPARVAPAVEATAWLCGAVGVGLLCYGSSGLVHYYSKDWQAVLSEPLLEPVSRLFVFFNLGMMPWLISLVSLYFVWTAYRFAKLSEGSLARLAESAWAGIAVVVIHQVLAFVNWARLSSSTTTLPYYTVGILSSLFMTALLGAPFLVLIWFLTSDAIVREFKRARGLRR
jgi:predicted Zn finger-like uncharacterized protein